MALLDNNLSGVAVITDSNQTPAPTPENFITLYDYLMQYQPELIPEYVYKYGKGSILGFIDATSKTGTYESDMVQHAESGRLMRTLAGVTISGNNFTFPEAHGLEVGKVVSFIDAGTRYQGFVSAIVSTTVATILNDGTDAWPAGPVDVSIDFSARMHKGSDGFNQGTRYGIDVIKNYSHILPHYQDTTDSDLGHRTWVHTDKGARWFNLEFEMESCKGDNKAEATAIFHHRADDASDSATAGNPQGMFGVEQIVEERGNVYNDLITTQDDLSDMALRLKQQGTVRELNVWARHSQMAAFRELCANLNAGFLDGFHYGSFKNSEDMFLKLDFSAVKIDGCQFNFAPWDALDDPSVAGITGAINFLGVPTGKTTVTKNGRSVNQSYLDILFRSNEYGVRRKEAKMFGKFGTPIKGDRSFVEWWTEFTVDLAAANNFFVGGAYNLASV